MLLKTHNSAPSPHGKLYGIGERRKGDMGEKGVGDKLEKKDSGG